MWKRLVWSTATATLDMSAVLKASSSAPLQVYLPLKFLHLHCKVVCAVWDTIQSLSVWLSAVVQFVACQHRFHSGSPTDSHHMSANLGTLPMLLFWCALPTSASLSSSFNVDMHLHAQDEHSGVFGPHSILMRRPLMSCCRRPTWCSIITMKRP